MKSSRFRIILALSLMIGLFSSCEKDGSGSKEYYVKFKVDGNWVTWSKVLGELVKDPGSNKSDFALTGHSDSDKEIFNIGIQVNGDFVPGTYNLSNSFLSVAYTKVIGATDFTSYTGGGIFGGPDTRYDITITSVTDKVIKGNFTGTFLENSSAPYDSVSITEGEFVIPQIR